MTATLHPNLEHQLATAVDLARDSRHHGSCHCGLFRSAEHSPFCSPQEWRASVMVDRILGQIQRLDDWP